MAELMEKAVRTRRSAGKEWKEAVKLIGEFVSVKMPDRGNNDG
jgi:hypothetical protein